MADDESQASSDLQDEEENERFLVEYFRKSPGVELFRPTIADEQKIGFFSLDRTTQTEESEIIDLKEMTAVIQQLLKDASSMKRDINFTRHVMEADFEAKLQQKSIDMYVRVNDRISEIEKTHQERVATVRRAFKTQLADAIARMHTFYTEKKQKSVNGEKYERKFRDMQATIQRNESIIQMLKIQLAEFQKEAEEQEEEEEEKPPSRSESVIAEIDSLREEVMALEEKISGLQDKVYNKDEENSKMSSKLKIAQEHLEKERVTIQQLRQEKEELLHASEQDKASAAKMMENEKLSAEREVEDRLRRAREDALAMARSEADQVADEERDKYKQLMDEKRKVEQLLAKERAKAKEKSQEAIDLEKARKNEERLLNEINKLKKEIERVHKTWEKKFAILQQSLHALKDESYVRQTMQRQAAQLHQASISYAYDTPVGVMPTRPAPPPPQVITPKRPLPDIPGVAGVRPNGKSAPAHDYISYTVSAPSGRATAMMSLDENQVMSDNEQDLPPDIVPLPSPPSRSNQDCRQEELPASAPSGGDISRASTRSHVVVLPSVEAQ